MRQLTDLFFLSNFIVAFSFIIQPKGPTHRNFVIKCINEITKDAIHFTKAKYTYYPQFLLTYLITTNLSTPGYEIQKEVLKLVHAQKVWSIEVLEDRRREFKSHEDKCNNFHERNPDFSDLHHAVGCGKKPVKNYKTQFYIMVVDNLENFYNRLDSFTKSSSFNSEALYLIYISKINPGNSNPPTEVIFKLMDYSITNSIVMVPKNLTTFDMFQLKIHNGAGSPCYSNSNIESSHQCIKGTITKHDTNLFKEQSLDNFRNCIIKVHAIPYEPFVINATEGIEIEVLRELGQAVNVSFEIEISEGNTYHLGEKDINGTWTGFVEPIYKFWHMGVGNIAPDNKFLPDFTYSVGYYTVKLVWVVPVAALIPRWRVLMVIFTMEVWGICLAVMFSFAILIYFSKTRNEVVTFKTFEKCFAAAFELLIGVPVPHQPITHFTRVFFIALAIFGIIINSGYTSSLVYYLQNPIREHQISTNIEIAVSGTTAGGPPQYKAMFEASPSPYAKTILKSYQTVNASLDTYAYWLNLVANKRNMATFVIKLCLNYLISKKRSIVTDRHGNSKVYILPQPLLSQSIGLMMRRGAFAREKFNSVIQKLIIEAGIIKKIKSDYVREGITGDESEMNDQSDDDDIDDHGVSALTTHHLEGAFAILALGHGFGLLVFIIEVVIYYISYIREKRKKTD